MLEGTKVYISKQKLWSPATFCLQLQQFFRSHTYKTKINPKTCIFSFSSERWVTELTWYLLVFLSPISKLDLQIIMKPSDLAKIK